MAIAEAPGPALPPGVPDPALLARLAGEFFAALPAGPRAAPPATGGVPLPANALPPGVSAPPGAYGPATPAAVPAGALAPGVGLVPSAPQLAANAVASLPSLVPHAVAGNGVPDNAVGAAPGYDARIGSHVLGVPDAYAAAARVPVAATADPGAAPSPYYFIADPGRDRGGEPAAGASPVPGDAIVARAHALPGGLLLREPGVPSPSAPTMQGTTPGHAQGTAPYYFVTDDAVARPPLPGAAIGPQPQGAHPPFDVHAVRRDFPLLAERVNGRPLVWFDNAATTQKPQAVIDRLAHFYRHENSNIHRAAHELAARATDAYEKARETVRRFIGASSAHEVVFVRGSTEAINLVAKSWGAQNVGPGDEIVVSHLEHHANIVPWQQLAAEKGARLRVIPVDDSGQVLLDAYQRLLGDRTKIVAVTQVSNALGTVVPVRDIIDLAHRAGACALVDGAQSVSHMSVDVRALDADFFVFSGHKVFGPTGIGVVYGKRALLDAMPPWQGGGNMIADVTFERTVYHGPPTRFEAGTGNIADAVGLATALEYVERIGLHNIARYEHGLLDYATAAMRAIDGVRLVGTARDKASVLSFVLAGYTTEEVGQALNEEGIAVRTGHHCAQPILRRFGLETTVRPSLAFYNTCEEVDRMVAVVRRLAGSRRS